MNTVPIVPDVKIPDRITVYPVCSAVELLREQRVAEQMMISKASRAKRPVHERTLKRATKAQKAHEAVKIERNAEDTSVVVSALTLLRGSE